MRDIRNIAIVLEDIWSLRDKDHVELILCDKPLLEVQDITCHVSSESLPSTFLITQNLPHTSDVFIYFQVVNYSFINSVEFH